jgi:hypothetical protein
VKEKIVKLYHITFLESAKQILKNGFWEGRVWFTNKENLTYWKRRFKDGNKLKLTVIEVKIASKFYKEEIYDWSKDKFSKGHPGQFTYGEGKHGWNEPQKRPVLKNGVNCEMRILTRKTV